MPGRRAESTEAADSKHDESNKLLYGRASEGDCLPDWGIGVDNNVGSGMGQVHRAADAVLVSRVCNYMQQALSIGTWPHIVSDDKGSQVVLR
jgi:hypothetical protein